ncbi:MAG: hypothetical protein IPI67_26435 [Myxococcales bacterium]|nr:hypothetical protein [Myxococcales bacterium]
MTVPPELTQDPAVVGPLGSLALSVIRPHTSTLALRALKWHRDLERLGVRMPLAVAHDLGLLLACPNEQLELVQRVETNELVAVTGAAPALFAGYRHMIEEVAESETARRSGSLRLTDDVIAVLLAKLLGSIARRIQIAPPYPTGVPLDAALVDGIDAQLKTLFAAIRRGFEVDALTRLTESRLYVLTLVDAIDLDTLQLFGMLGGDAGAGALAQVDLLGVLGAPEANDVVDFSLEILPSVLESKARPGASTHAAFGYSGLARKGSIDGLVLTELAWDEQELMRRMADDEVLYYAREQAQDEARRVHHFLVDASASMRGERATFARGMAIASAKKLLLAGEDIVFRFFDSRLYESHPARAGQLPIGYLLSFRGEHGRNPARVFAEVERVLALASTRDPREPVVHIFTHGALYVPREVMASIKRRAKVSALFMLPSGGELDLDYLDLLDAHWVVSHAALASRAGRAKEARRILGTPTPVQEVAS